MITEYCTGARAGFAGSATGTRRLVRGDPGARPARPREVPGPPTTLTLSVRHRYHGEQATLLLVLGNARYGQTRTPQPPDKAPQPPDKQRNRPTTSLLPAPGPQPPDKAPQPRRRRHCYRRRDRNRRTTSLLRAPGTRTWPGQPGYLLG
jgi:hypothetical protein